MSAKDDIDRRKLMDWIRPDEDYGGVVGMLGTTFELDPTFFDSDYLPTFLGLGAWEDTSWTNRVSMERALRRTEATVVMMDARRFRGRPRSLHIEVMPKVGSAGIKLHAKVLLVVQERAIRLLVGSANLTDWGYRHNREVALPIVATAQTPRLSALVEQALRTMPEPLRPWWTPAAAHVHGLALQTMSDWPKTESANDRFVWSWGKQSLATQFTSMWPDEQILTVTIISPFWSDQGDGGPIAQLISQLGHDRVAGAKLRLLTDAAPETQTSFRPKVPASLAAWDTRRLSIEGQIQAVDPHVLPEEVGGRSDYQPTRPLHAKAVVVEGSKTTLAYFGSANFTLHGWGFAGAASNIEAGVIMLRQGGERRNLQVLIPKTIGMPVPLDGKGRSAITLLEKSNDERLWPDFIHDIRLVPTGVDRKQLQLVAQLTSTDATTSFSVSLLADKAAALLDQRTLASGALEPTVLEQLLRDQRVNVRWQAGSIEFPLNVDLEARLLLPISPGSPPPGENLLLAYYQGRITADDIYPPPLGESDYSPPPLIPGTEIESIVDIDCIQSYQIREFVEALYGIRGDLQLAAKGTETAMKYVLLGDVSPVALAREVMRAVQDRRRSATAAGFQLVEIMACLATAERFDVPANRHVAWRDCVARARKEVTMLLSDLSERNGGELKYQRSFQRYRSTILAETAAA